MEAIWELLIISWSCGLRKAGRKSHKLLYLLSHLLATAGGIDKSLFRLKNGVETLFGMIFFQQQELHPVQKTEHNHTERTLPLQHPKFTIKECQLCCYVSIFFEQPLQNHATYLTCHPAENMLHSQTAYRHLLRDLNVSRDWAQRLPKTGWRGVCLKPFLSLSHT